MLEIDDKIKIPIKEFRFSFARGSGPGGQNVNKLNTKVTLKWSVTKSPSLTDSLRERIQKKYPRKINNEGDMVIYSHRFRDQGRNVTDCLSKLQELIREAAKQNKRRVPTKTPYGAKKRRLNNKKFQAAKKALRKPPKMD